MPPLPKPLYGINAFKQRLDLKWNKLKYSKWSNDIARSKYANLVSRDPGRALTAAQQKEITEFARDFWGSAHFAPWLMVYAATARAFRPGCVPDNYVGVYVLRYVIGAWRQKMDRIYQKRILQTDLMPDILYGEDGRLIFPSGEDVPPDQLSQVIFERGDRAVLKLAQSSKGLAVFYLTRDGFHPDMLPKARNFVIQHELRQDPQYDRWNNGGTTTLRLTTAMTPRGADTRELKMRFSRDGQEIMRAYDEICVAVDRATGAYSELALANDWTPLYRHPDSGIRFAGNRMEHLDDMTRTCEALHNKVPGVAYMGWDLCLMEGGQFGIMEVNVGHSSINFAESMHGPNYADLGWEKLHREHPIL